MMPSQYVRAEPFATFIDVLQKAGENIKLPKIDPIPPLLKAL